jgi:hypothetical protein
MATKRTKADKAQRQGDQLEQKSERRLEQEQARKDRRTPGEPLITNARLALAETAGIPRDYAKNATPFRDVRLKPLCRTI